MITLKQYQVPAAALLFFAAGQANSASCGALSPRLLELGDQYYEPTIVARSAEETDRETAPASTLEQLLNASFRSGSGERVTCLGTGQRSRSVTAIFELKSIQNRSLLNGEHVLSAWEDVHTVLADTDDRIDGTGSIHSMTVSLPPLALWQENAPGKGFSSVLVNRRKNALNRSLLQERVWLLVPSANGVELEVHDYTNGVHGGSMMWRLRSS